jgi:hypothetical protein
MSDQKESASSSSSNQTTTQGSTNLQYNGNIGDNSYYMGNPGYGGGYGGMGYASGMGGYNGMGMGAGMVNSGMMGPGMMGPNMMGPGMMNGYGGKVLAGSQSLMQEMNQSIMHFGKLSSIMQFNFQVSFFLFTISFNSYLYQCVPRTYTCSSLQYFSL